jgi:hypothetical protein
MKHALLAVTLAALSALAWAQDDEAGPPEASTIASEKPKLVRQDSLELPGLTACHQCEWRPKPHQMAAQEQCGMTPDGHPKVGVYECGFSPECQRVCNFVRCAD